MPKLLITRVKWRFTSAVTTVRGVASCILKAIVLSHLLPLPVAAQSPPVRFSHITPERGLSQSSVNAIVQDRQGFMWFGTQDGLNRFDGVEFTVFRNSPGDTLSISDNYIWCLLEDRAGTLWAGTQSGGLVSLQLDGRSFRRYLHNSSDRGSLTSNAVTALCESPAGELWVGTWGGGLEKFDTRRGTFEQFVDPGEQPRGLTGKFVRAIAEDSAGLLWTGTWGGGLTSYERNTGRFRHYRHDASDPHSISGDRITALCVESGGALWIGTFDQGVDVFDAVKGGFTRFRNNPRDLSSLSSNSVVAICEDRSGCLWVTTRDAGVNRYDPATGRFTRYRRDPGEDGSPGSDRVSSVYRDLTGGMWVGTNDAGVDHYDPDNAVFTRSIETPSGNIELRPGVVRSILQDARGDLWVGTASAGLDRYVRSSGKFVNYRHIPGDVRSLTNDAVMALYEDREGRLWIGTDGGGLDRFDPRRSTLVHYRAGEKQKRRISGESVMSIYEDSRGEILVGTTGSGLDVYDRTNDRFIPFEEAHGIGTRIADNVWSICEDKKGGLWFGTWGQGLVRYDDSSGALTRYMGVPGDPSTLGNNTVWSIYQDGQGILWLGTWGGGLNRLDPATGGITRFTEHDGLSNNVVYGVIADNRGNIWVSTNRGIAMFDPRTYSFTLFDHRDGLQSDEFNQGAYFRGRDGMLYFGGINGLNAFQADSIRPNGHIPPVVLTRFRVFGREMPSEEPLSSVREIRLNYNENYLSFEFAALGFTEAEKNQYAYKMEGIDRDWIYCGTRRYAAYTHLDGGSYTFRVKGSNNDGVWNEQGASVAIVIALPFWRQIWFIAGSLAIAAMTVFGLFRYRLAKVLEMERLRTSIASDLHDELASNLSSIAMFSNIVHTAAGGPGVLDADQRQLLGRITSLSQESVTSIRDIIWAIDPKSESLFDLMVRIRDYLLPLCRAAGIDLQFPDPVRGALPGKNLRPGERKDLWLLLKEGVTNAIRHSHCRTLQVSYHYAAGVFSASIRDDGCGFITTPESAGRGMQTMSMRAAQLSATLIVDSIPGKGTSIRFFMKM